MKNCKTFFSKWLDYIFFHQKPMRVALAQKMLKLLPVRHSKRIEYDAVDRPHYGYVLYSAARQAKALGYSKIMAIEFGVFKGNGLLNLEYHAREISKELGIGIEVVGFDAGTGLPAPTDYRDLPHIWHGGAYKMDVPWLKSRLSFSRLILGDVRNTLSDFLKEEGTAPLGCCFFDLDYYSSTVEAFKIFDLPAKRKLPRVICYFDDIHGDAITNYCEFTGELLAIDEFNASHPLRKIAKIHGLSLNRRVPSKWTDQLYTSHDFEHPQYSTFIGERDPESL